jgi:hypothetical protein
VLVPLAVLEVAVFPFPVPAVAFHLFLMRAILGIDDE